MSSQIPIGQSPNDLTAPTPQNTPLNAAPISTGLSRPTVPAIAEEGEETAGGIQDAVLGLVQGRLASLVGKSSGYLESLPLPQKQRLQALKGVQTKQTELQNAYKNECLALEKKYLGLTNPLYTRRSELVNGTGAPPLPEEVEKGEEASKKDDEEYQSLPKEIKEDEGSESVGKGIPEFWLSALRNHIGISDLITDRDAEALKHLTDIRLSYLDDKPGFKLSFHFSPNEFFENEVLEKTYLYQTEVGYSGDFVYDRAIGTEIKWKEDKDLTKEFEIKKQRNKNTNRTRLVRKSKPADSFFNFFYPPVPPKLDEENEDDEQDPEELEELEERLEVDYQIGEDLKEKVIPKAVDYFTGKALEYDILEGDDDSDWDDDEDDEDEDDDDELGEDDEDDEDDVPVPRRSAGRRGGRAGGRGGAAGGNQQVSAEECRQQ